MTTAATTTTTSAESTTAPAPQQQAGVLLSQVAGHVGVRTVAMGLRHGLLAALADHADGLTADQLAERCAVDPFYAAVWCRAAYGAQVLERADDGAYILGPHMAALLLDTDHPGYVGGIFTIMTYPELFDSFAERLPSGERIWWDQTSHEFIRAVAGTGRPFYIRLVPGGLARVPGLEATLQAGATVLDTACGAGTGLLRLARTYPEIQVVGADGDAYSLEVAAERIEDAGLTDRIELIHTPLEELDTPDRFDLVINNISMHECRDIDRVTDNIRRALRPDGWFVISDFPFPDGDEGLRTVPGRVMSGIQYYEAQIDDQLLPVSAYLDLLPRHGFRDVDTVTLTPVHALTFGRR